MCCRMVGKSVALAKMLVKRGSEDPATIELANFPYEADESGACIKLVDNRCSVYETRPDICNVKKIWQKYFSGKIKLREFIHVIPY